jgi:two-component system sensor histidine kinase/response regulator
MTMAITGTTSILIIDDKEANIFALEKLLEQPGRAIRSATNGNDGLRIALNEEIDLIILDVQMPEMDGFEVAQILKSNRKTKDIPIIFASAEKKEKHSMIKGFEEGAVDYLSKPLDPELTKAKVAVLLKIQQQKKELLEKNLSLEKAEAQIRQLNSDLQSNLVRLEFANKELESFSYSVSHDLRAPLRSIMGYTKILEEDAVDKLSSDEIKILEIIQQNANKMNTLIDDLLAFARIGKQDINKTKVDSDKLVQRVINDFNTLYQHKADIKVETLPEVYADDALLNQVWFNLLSNALKYSSKKEKPVVEIGTLKSDSNIVFFVKDNGVGFNMEFSGKLFGVFQRLHRQSEFEGTGVGLALVQRIVSRHGGKIWAEGKIDEGATFYFSLPESRKS